MKEVRKNLILEFETTKGSKVELKILKPIEGLTGSEIKAAMDTVVATESFGNEAQASKVIGARYDIRQIDEITLV